LTGCVKNEDVLRQSQEEKEYPTYSKRKANGAGHILRRNFLLKRVIEEKIEGKIEVNGMR